MGSRKDAHETILTTLEQICNNSGLTTGRSIIPSVQKSDGTPVGATLSSRTPTSVGAGISFLTLSRFQWQSPRRREPQRPATTP